MSIGSLRTGKGQCDHNMIPPHASPQFPRPVSQAHCPFSPRQPIGPTWAPARGNFPREHGPRGAEGAALSGAGGRRGVWAGWGRTQYRTLTNIDRYCTNIDPYRQNIYTRNVKKILKQVFFQKGMHKTQIKRPQADCD